MLLNIIKHYGTWCSYVNIFGPGSTQPGLAMAY